MGEQDLHAHLLKAAEAFDKITNGQEAGHAGYRLENESVRAYRLFLQAIEAGALPAFPMEKWPHCTLEDGKLKRLPAAVAIPDGEVTPMRVDLWQKFAFPWLARAYPDAFTASAAGLHKIDTDEFSQEDWAGYFDMLAASYAEACRLLAELADTQTQASDDDRELITVAEAAQRYVDKNVVDGLTLDKAKNQINSVIRKKNPHIRARLEERPVLVHVGDLSEWMFKQRDKNLAALDE